MSSVAPEKQWSRVPPECAAVLAWLAYALGHVTYSWVSADSADPPALATLLVGGGHLLAVGAAWAVALAAGRRLFAGKWARRLAAWAAVACWAAYTMPDDLVGFSTRVGGVLADVVLWSTLLAFAAAVPMAWRVGEAFRAPLFAIAACGMAWGSGLLEPRILSGLYPAMHLHGAWIVVALAASTIAFTRWRVRPRVLRLLCVALGLGGAITVIAPLPPLTRSQLAAAGAPLLPFLPVPSEEAAHGTGVDDDPWFKSRANLSDVPPTQLERPVDQPIVILLTIDALRSDVFEEADVEGSLPMLARMRDGGMYFDNAHAAGSGTTYTLASLFMGTYFSQQYWTGKGLGMFPKHDEHTRFPELLTAAGVHTVNISATSWLGAKYGIVRGSSLERYPTPLEKERGHSPWVFSPQMADIVIEELAAMPGGRPAFFYAHLLDAHNPYQLSGKKDSPFEGYLAELGRVDTAVDQIWTAVRRLGLAPRTYFIISSDHGESFGERGKRFHAWGLKEDLIHVPLLVHGPGVGRGSDNALVSTNDIGPTVLDVFGVPTPAAFIGESLLPHALGHPRPLTRPVLAETRLKQAFLHPDGIKVIRDNRRGTVEVYDLRYDPGELRNRVGDMTPTMRQALLQLDQFFRVHTYRVGGYSPPYRP